MNGLSADILIETYLNDGSKDNLEIDFEEELTSYKVFNTDFTKTIPNVKNSSDVCEINQPLQRTYVNIRNFKYMKQCLNENEAENITNYTLADKENPIIEDTYSCLKEFDTVLNNIRKEHFHQCNTKFNNLELSNSHTNKTFDDIENSSKFSTWHDMYESFALANHVQSSGDNEYKDEIGNNLSEIKRVPSNGHLYRMDTNPNLNLLEPKMHNKPEDKERNVQTMMLDVTETSSYDLNDHHRTKRIKLCHFTCSNNDDVISIGSDNFKDALEYPLDDIIATRTMNLTDYSLKSKKVQRNTRDKGSNNDVISISSDDFKDALECPLDNIIGTKIDDLRDTVDVISLSSNEVKDMLNISDDYNSSDFEFIDEEEAKSDGLFHLYPKGKAKDISKELNANGSMINDYFKSIKLGGPNEIRKFDGNYHNIPDDNDYVALFEGNFSPHPLGCFENKSTNSGPSMYVEFTGIGFDVKVIRDKSTPEQRRDAEETEEKILSMYPSMNEIYRHRKRK